VAPQGEARSNLWLAQALAVRLGVADPIFRMAEPEILRELLHGARGATAGFEADAVRGAGPIRIAVPETQEFRTPSGKLEFYSESLKAKGVPPMPDWAPHPDEEREAARWPFRLLTAPGYFQPHTAYSGVAFLRRREGAPCCILHPDDAASRGLAQGQKVRLFNDRGAVGLVLKISDEVQRGVILVPGNRRDDETLSGTINMLCSDRYTDIGEGATYQSTWLDIAPLA
jgi:anaerobic selenocysteine-containing dehydrogenase